MFGTIFHSNVMIWGSVYRTIDNFPELKSHYPYKVILILYSSSHITSIQEPVYMWSWSFSLTYILFNMRVILCVSVMQILNKMLTQNCHTYPGKQPQFYRNHVGLERVELPFPGFPGNGMIPIESCITTATLWDERCLLGSRWEDLTLRPRGLYQGKHELLVSRYVDTDIKSVPSDGWYIWIINIISIFSHMTSTLIMLLNSKLII